MVNNETPKKIEVQIKLCLEFCGVFTVSLPFIMNMFVIKKQKW